MDAATPNCGHDICNRPTAQGFSDEEIQFVLDCMVLNGQLLITEDGKYKLPRRNNGIPDRG